MRYKITQYVVTKRKQQKQQTEQQRLLADIREALSQMWYIELSSCVLSEAMEAITPVVGRYVVQAKKRIW